MKNAIFTSDSLQRLQRRIAWFLNAPATSVILTHNSDGTFGVRTDPRQPLPYVVRKYAKRYGFENAAPVLLARAA